MLTKQRCAVLVWIGLGVFVTLYSYHIGLGRFLEPGPGLMPFVLGVVMLLLSLFKLAIDVRSQVIEERKRTGTENGGSGRVFLGKIAAVAAGLLAFALLLEPLGYLLTTFLVLSFLLKVAGYERWLRVLPYSAIITLVTYFGFTYLGTRFPQGILSFPGM
jgi:putative tricarboxylic transport membrane protein